MNNSFETLGEIKDEDIEDIEIVEPENIEEGNPTKEEVEEALKELMERTQEIEKRKN